jgi:Molybdopterin-binding domain of aldehyde dehydrogenase
LADLVVSDRDLFACPESDIGDTTSLLTMVGGKVLYAAGEFASEDEVASLALVETLAHDRPTLCNRRVCFHAGMADCTMGTFRMASKAEVRLKADGSATVEAGFHDIGSGTMTVMPQIAADVLGLPIERVGTRNGDTRLPQAGPTYGSSSTLAGGSAVYLAAVDARDKLARLAGIEAGQTWMRDGLIGAPGQPGRPVSEVMRSAGIENSLALETGLQLPACRSTPTAARDLLP